jgi:SRSO17 transposase
MIFKTKTGKCYDKAIYYIKALYTTEKSHRNIEKMTDGYSKEDYYKIQHFISESPWSAAEAMADAAKDVNSLFEGRKHIALVIDESSEEKKGIESVGVGHQYCGNLGKTCNSQVAVYGALASDNLVSIIDTRLYLPKSWTEDSKRCDKVGIPKTHRDLKTKPELALEIIKAQRAAGIRFDWINADGLYGHDLKFLNALEQLNELYVIDIHNNKSIFLEEFQLEIKEKKSGRGRTPSRLLPNIKPISADVHIASLNEKDWEKVTLRNGTKGVLAVEAYMQHVYVFDEIENKCSHKLLIVSRNKNSKGNWEYKYAFSNAKEGAFTIEQLAYMLCHRFWVEHAFREAKQELGMTDYQVRGWLAWHHHMALVMMAMAFSLSEKITQKEEMPLLSASDIRLILINKFAQTSKAKYSIEEQIKIRHQQRKNDIINRYKRNGQIEQLQV